MASDFLHCAGIGSGSFIVVDPNFGVTSVVISSGLLSLGFGRQVLGMRMMGRIQVAVKITPYPSSKDCTADQLHARSAPTLPVTDGRPERMVVNGRSSGGNI